MEYVYSAPWELKSFDGREKSLLREATADLLPRSEYDLRWLADVLRCRFDFDRQVAMRLAEQLGADPAEALERFRRAVSSTTKPPLPAVAMLGEAIVHGEDIRRPLGLRREYPIDVVTQVAEYYSGSDLVVLAKGRISGLRLVADDGPFRTGSGPLVSGTTSALVMATTGRSAYCDELKGDGVELLRTRCAG